MDSNAQAMAQKNIITRVVNLNASAEAMDTDARKVFPMQKLPVKPMAGTFRLHIKSTTPTSKEEAKLPPVVLVPKSISDGAPRPTPLTTVAANSADASKAAYSAVGYRKLLNKLSNPVTSESNQAESSKITTAAQISSNIAKIISGTSILNSAHTRNHSPNVSKAMQQLTISSVEATPSNPVAKPAAPLGQGLQIRFVPKPQPSLLNDKINAATLKKRNQVPGSDGGKDADRKTTTAHYVIKKDAIGKFKDLSSLNSMVNPVFFGI